MTSIRGRRVLAAAAAASGAVVALGSPAAAAEGLCPARFAAMPATTFSDPPLPAFVDGNRDGTVCVLTTHFGLNIIDNRVPSRG